MSGNRSLDEFAGGGAGDGEPDVGSSGTTVEPESSEGGAAVESGSGKDEPIAADAARSPDDVATPDEEPTDDDAPATDDAPDRPASTYTWRPDGADCEACGATVEERWREGEDLVCAGCKEW